MHIDPNDFYRRNLPHYCPPGATFFVTFRLAGSLPLHVIKQLQQERDDEVKRIQKDARKNIPRHMQNTYANEEQKASIYRAQKRYFGKFDDLLDSKTHGPTWLERPDIAKIVKEAIHHRDGKEYGLVCYTIMPNHVHLVIEAVNASDQDAKFDLSKTLQNVKRYTGTRANRVLDRVGHPFWQDESYDHVVRDDHEFANILRYVVNNPVKAGLTDDWEHWAWTYITDFE